MRRTFHVIAALVLAVPLALAAQGQRKPAAGAPVILRGQTLFTVRAGVGSLSPAERAEIINQRLEQIAAATVPSAAVRTQETDAGSQITVGNRPVILVTTADAQAENTDVPTLAARWATILSQTLNEKRRASLRDLVWRLAITLIVLVCAFGLVFALRWERKFLEAQIERRRERLPTLHLRGLELVSPQKLYAGLQTSLRTITLLLMLLVVIGAALLIFGQFPATRGYVAAMLGWLWQPLHNILVGALNYLPDLFYIFVIVVVTRVVLRMLSFIFLQAERGVINLAPWIHRDVARPTGTLVKAIVVILALFFIAPLIPGTGSRAAQAITLILGLMVSFGSTSTVGNVIAGIVLTYMRPFRLGERVHVGNVTGDVVERTFLYTKLRTIKNEEVIVPSLQAINSAITNYSALASRQGLILHTNVTISYDVPWRKIHELLLAAAAKTKDVMKETPPFVWQTALNDFFVSYQLNVFTHRADHMMAIYAELHQNIQDTFNEAGIEILSPHYFQVRDGNFTSIPESYRPPDYRPGRFLVDARMPEGTP